MDEFRTPAKRERKSRVCDYYNCIKDADRSTASSRERGVKQIQAVDRDQHQSTFKDTGGSGGTHRSSKTDQKYTSTGITRPWYEFHLNENGKPEEKPEDEGEDEKKSRKKKEIGDSEDSNLSVSPQKKRKTMEPELLEEEEEMRQAVVKRETVTPESSGCESSKDCGLVNPPDVQTRKVDEPDDDDDKDDLDILMIDLSDKERA